MKAKPKTKLEFPHYWMCSDCATKMGGVFPEGHICTVTSGQCEYCGKDPITLIPWVDFNWPKHKQQDTIAKISRD